MLDLHLMMSKHDGRGSMLCLRWNNGHIRSGLRGCLVVCLIWHTQTNKKSLGAKTILYMISQQTRNDKNKRKYTHKMTYFDGHNVMAFMLMRGCLAVSTRQEWSSMPFANKETNRNKEAQRKKTKCHASSSTFIKMDKNQLWQHW